MSTRAGADSGRSQPRGVDQTGAVQVRLDEPTPTDRQKYAVKLNSAQVLEIRALWASGITQAEIARRFGVHPSHVSRLVRGLHWLGRRYGRPAPGPTAQAKPAPVPDKPRRPDGRAVNWSTKLTESDVRAIRAARAAGDRPRDLAERYGVRQCTISNICAGRTWAGGGE